VIGVVKDYNFRSFHHKIEPMALLIYRPWLYSLSVMLETGDINQALTYLERTLKPYWSEIPFQYSFLDEDFAKLYENEKRSGQLFGIFSLLAVMISCLGLFALASYTAEQKTKEIGVRKVLGSSVVKVVVSLSWRFAVWVIAAAGIALPIAWCVMNGWLQNFAYRIKIGVDIFLLSSGMVLLVAMAAISYRLFRAASANPVDSLRYE
jgi:putative ABC transport system permease protein